MANIRPRRLTIKNFRSFLNEATFEFPERGLVLVRGWNADAGDTSGSGKSSFLEALAYANDISEFPATEHQCWHTDEPFEITYDFELDDGRGGRRKLGKTTTLSFDKSPLLKSAKAIKEQMASIVGLNTDMLKALVYRPQRQPGLFLTMTDSKKKEFLTSLLGLGQFEVEAERSQKRITELEWARDLQLAGVEHDRAAITDEPSWAPQEVSEEELAALKHLLKRVEDALPALEKKYEASNDEFLELLRAIDAAHSQADKPVREARDRVAAQVIAVDPAILEQEKKVMARLAVIDERIADAKKQWKADDKHFTETIKGFRAGASCAREYAAPKAEYQSQLVDIQKQIVAIESATCPTCERVWQTGQKKLAELTVEAAELDQAIHECIRYEEEAAALTKNAESWEASYSEWKLKPQVPAELADVREKLVTSLATISQQKNSSVQQADAERRLKLAEFEQRLNEIANQYAQEDDELRARWTPLFAHLSNEMTALKEQVKGLREQVKAEERRLNEIRESNRRGQAQFQVAHDQWMAAKKRLEESTAILQQYEDDLNAEKDFLATIGREGFLGLIFDDVLTAISNETNDILANVPNVAHVTLQFQSERETQEGKLRKEIRPVLNANGREITLRSLSGGMQAAVELAVDIAVGNVVSQRTGVFPGWLVLDEAFDGLGVNAKKACLDILKKAAEHRLIIVVDHATEVREAFDQTINITLKDGTSVLS